MQQALTQEMAEALNSERLEQADRFRRGLGTRPEHDHEEAYDSVTVCRSHPGDEAVLRRLAERDGRRLPANPVLVAEVGGRLLAARSLDDGSSISDPFHPTEHLIELLALRSAHLRETPDPPPRPRLAALLRLVPQLRR